MSNSFAILWTAAHQVLCPWNSPGKNTGVGSHFLLQGSSWPRGWTQVSWIGRWILYHWATREAQAKTVRFQRFKALCQSPSLEPTAEGTRYLYIYMNHFAVYGKLTQHCKSTMKKKRNSKRTLAKLARTQISISWMNFYNQLLENEEVGFSWTEGSWRSVYSNQISWLKTPSLPTPNTLLWYGWSERLGTSQDRDLIQTFYCEHESVRCFFCNKRQLKV